MKEKIKTLSNQYRNGLRTYLHGNSNSHSLPARRLGQQALSRGLGTIDLATLHGKTLETLIPPSRESARDEKVKRAAWFFMNVLAPVDSTRRAAVENLAKLEHTNEALKLRTTELTAANLHLKAEVIQRKAVESRLKQSEQNHRVLLREARHMQLRLRHLSHQVLSAQEEERKEISRELHDEIVQTLTGINVQLASLNIESGISKQSFSKHIKYTQRLVEKSVNIVHQFARDLRPTLLDDLGLIPAMHAFMKGFTERTGIHINFTTFAGVEKLSNDKRTVLYRVAQAALINISQHAHATRVSVAVKELPQAVQMQIKDDGKSFDVAHVLDSRRNKRLGLIGMRERVEMVGGEFQVESAPGSGTTVTARLPFRQSK